MKPEWGRRFVELLHRHRGNLNEKEFAQRLGLPRSSYQRIAANGQSIKYHQVEIALRRLGVCHCEVVGLDCPHRSNGERR